MAIKAARNATVRLIDGSTVNVSIDELDFEVAGNQDRQMGPETHYSATHHFGDNKWMTWEVWEYPTGAVNHQFARGKGCQIVSDFDFHIED